MSQFSLFCKEPEPPRVDCINLRHMFASEMLAHLELLEEPFRPDLIIADPPWNYSNQGNPAAPYPCMTIRDIVDDLHQAYDASRDNAILLVWVTWPFIFDFIREIIKWDLEMPEGFRWEPKTGGSWHKNDSGFGAGHYWRGRSEALLLFKKGKPKIHKAIQNKWESPAQEHSAKPIHFLRLLVQAFSCPESGSVADMYAGLGSLACACKAEGRDYDGAEIDEKRFSAALVNIARYQA